MQRFFQQRLFLMMVLSWSQLYSQDLGIQVLGGVLNYQGDLRQEVYTFQGVRLGYGMGVTYAITRHLSAGLQFIQGNIAADDRNNTDPGLFYRNLNFVTKVSECNLHMTFHLLDMQRARVNPYVSGGMALFRFNPYTRDLAGDTYYLQPLGTEGQGLPGYGTNPYQLTQFSLPFGGGIDLKIGQQLRIGWEVIFRRTNTDYLDDVSTVYANQIDLLIGRGAKAVELAFRGDEVPGPNPVFLNGYPDRAKRGNPNAKDWYYYSGLKATFTLSSRDRNLLPVKTGKSRTDCPRW